MLTNDSNPDSQNKQQPISDVDKWRQLLGETSSERNALLERIHKIERILPEVANILAANNYWFFAREIREWLGTDDEGGAS